MGTAGTKDFAHLHVHSEYSLLDGLSRVKALVAQARDYGMRHLAITDHGVMYGVMDFYLACREAGINPVIGVEAYLAEDMSDHSRLYSDDYYHLLLLAKDNVGYHNLMKLTTVAHTEGWHRRPRIDKRVLEKYAQGLIVTSSCLSGEIPRLLLAEKRAEAYKAAHWYRGTFGPENFYLEIQEHHGVQQDGQPSPQGKLNRLLTEMHRDLHIPLVATNDLHYVRQDEAVSQEVLLCIQTQKQLSDAKRMKFDSHHYYMKSQEEMYQLFPEAPEALLNTVRIAEQCEVRLDLGRARLPDYPIPAGFGSQGEYLYALCLQGVRDRFGGMSEPLQKQLDYEFGVISQKGFVSYFLIVWDFVHYARSQGIRCSARGSAAGCLLAYVLGITNVDPLRYQLLFERFINPQRDSLPDIDMDFPDDRREEVINYVTQKYGPDRVAQMVTFNTMAARASVRDVARVMGCRDLGDRIARLIPKKGELAVALETVKDLGELYVRDWQAKQVLDQSMKLEGGVRSTGVHAAGVIISGDPLAELVPLQLRDTKDPGKGRITQYEQAYLEKLGLLKMDFLGLSNLTILQNAVENIRGARGLEVELDAIPLDDGATFKLLSAGETTAIFQLEGQQMREYIRQLRPTCIEDLTAMVALYRPGPMESIPDFIDAKHGRKKVTYLDPRLERWLKESYGTIVYQDQVLLIAVHLAGFSWGEVDKFRKAMGKKVVAEIEKYKDAFIDGCVRNGVRPDVAGRLYELILPFGGYGFNKAHAASYAIVAYRTAYLKAHFPAEFLAATLTVEASDTKKVSSNVAECRHLGVRVLPPDVNHSSSGFTVDKRGAVRFGLFAIKGVGDGPIAAIEQAREEGGPFTSLADFCTRLDPKLVTKSIIEVLIKAGAMDAFGPRYQLIDALDRVVVWARSRRATSQLGQHSLFGGAEGGGAGLFEFALRPDAPVIERKELLRWERELTGVYLSEHPLESLAKVISLRASHTTAAITEETVGQKITVAGLVGELRRITTKRGDAMCVARLEDLHGSISVTVFPRLFEQTSHLLVEDGLLLVYGEVQDRNDELGILAERIDVLQPPGTGQQQPLPGFGNQQVQLSLYLRGGGGQGGRGGQPVMKALQSYLDARPGKDTFELVVDADGYEVRLDPKENTVHYSSDLQMYLEDLLGPEAVELRDPDQPS